MMQGKISSKYQLTLPSEVRRALNLEPGDMVRYELTEGSVRLSVVRPDLGKVLDDILDEYDFSALRRVTADDAIDYVRKMRGLDD